MQRIPYYPYGVWVSLILQIESAKRAQLPSGGNQLAFAQWSSATYSLQTTTRTIFYGVFRMDGL